METVHVPLEFTASFDTQAWVKYWFLEPSNVSPTKDLLCISHKMGIY